VHPLRSDFALCWHRDSIKNSAVEDEERALLEVQHYGVCEAFVKSTELRLDDRFATGPVEYVSTLIAYPAHGDGWPMAHSALHEDSSLYVVPGSHRVPRTAAQRAMSSNTIAPTDPLAMPGAMGVTLKRTSEMADDICNTNRC
jgi:hypothetical protein